MFIFFSDTFERKSRIIFVQLRFQDIEVFFHSPKQTHVVEFIAHAVSTKYKSRFGGKKVKTHSPSPLYLSHYNDRELPPTHTSSKRLDQLLYYNPYYHYYYNYNWNSFEHVHDGRRPLLLQVNAPQNVADFSLRHS